MSMDFSEYLRRLGAEPRSRDADMERARASGPEFREAAEAADRFENLLDRALDLPAPAGLPGRLSAIARRTPPGRYVRLAWPAALAAGLLLAAGAWLLQSRLAPGWDTVEDYVMDHYRHDGTKVLDRANGIDPGRLESMLADFGVGAAPALVDSVRLVKYCPTPDGEGLHLVLDSPQGLVTLIYMPRTGVNDRQTWRFDDREALLVALPRGSAAIIGRPEQQLAGLYPLVHESIHAEAPSDRG